MNSKMVKCGMVLLTEKEKTDVAVGYMLQPAAGGMVDKREKES
jgi:hypothetical protein